MLLKLKHGESIQIETPDGYVLVSADKDRARLDAWDRQTRPAEFRATGNGTIEALLPH